MKTARITIKGPKAGYMLSALIDNGTGQVLYMFELMSSEMFNTYSKKNTKELRAMLII